MLLLLSSTLIHHPLLSKIHLSTCPILRNHFCVISRHVDPSWSKMSDIRFKYDLLFGVGFIAFSIVVIIGLLLKKEWGRQWAIAFDALLLFCFLGIRILSYLYFKIAFNEGSLR